MPPDTKNHVTRYTSLLGLVYGKFSSNYPWLRFVISIQTSSFLFGYCPYTFKKIHLTILHSLWFLMIFNIDEICLCVNEISSDKIYPLWISVEQKDWSLNVFPIILSYKVRWNTRLHTYWTNPILCPSKEIIFSIIYMNSLGDDRTQTVCSHEIQLMVNSKPENLFRTFNNCNLLAIF